jgi:hypothetical protein
MNFFMFTDEGEWDQAAFDGWTTFSSFKELCQDFNIKPGDHTSAGDVRATREVFKSLVGIS